MIVGNEQTPQEIILRQVPLYPGQVLNYPDLLVAEKNLARLGIFKVSPDGSVKPTVTVMDPESDNEFKDILITVQEKNSGSQAFVPPPAPAVERNSNIKRPSAGLKELLQHYQAAYDAGRMEEATLWAIRALAVDPACFSTKPESKQGR